METATYKKPKRRSAALRRLKMLVAKPMEMTRFEYFVDMILTAATADEVQSVVNRIGPQWSGFLKQAENVLREGQKDIAGKYVRMVEHINGLGIRK